MPSSMETKTIRPSWCGSALSCRRRKRVLRLKMRAKASTCRRFPTRAILLICFKSSGRGVLLIYNIMDEVEYNAQGNRVKMVKRPERCGRNSTS